MSAMKCIMCVDNSGSTVGVTTYWDKVSLLHQQLKPDILIYWNTTAQVKERFEVVSGGETKPSCFIKMLARSARTIGPETDYDLIITTDGEIHESDILECKKVEKVLLKQINSTTIHYIGNEHAMNIGLNVIFGKMKNISYYINDRYYERLYDRFDCLQYEDIVSPNFPISLVVKLKNLDKSDSKAYDENVLQLRDQICRLFSELEQSMLDEDVNKKIEELRDANKPEEFMALMDADRGKIAEINKKKSQILNLFDKQIDINISRLMTGETLVEKDIEMDFYDTAFDFDDTEMIKTKKVTSADKWKQFEDVITLEYFRLPCLLVKNTDTPLVTHPVILKHPFKLLGDEETIKKIMLLIEPNPIDYTTYKKLKDDNGNVLISPHTRDVCKGVFLFDATHVNLIKNNCYTISIIFGNENKVPGNYNLWNLVILFLIYKYKLHDTEYRHAILEEIKKYCSSVKAKVCFTHFCKMPRSVRIQTCLWYAIYTAPKVSPYKTKNVLRSPFGLELFNFYMEIFGDSKHEYLNNLSNRVKKWAVWNYLCANKHRNDRRIHREVKAQYQNYCEHNGDIIFLKGPCQRSFKSIFNLITPTEANTLLANLKHTSSKTNVIDHFQTVPCDVEIDDVLDPCENAKHVKINTETCWPFVTCQVSGKHWRECIQDYDVKNASLFRLFNRYCIKYKKYPDSYLDLALLHSTQNREYCLTTGRMKDLQNVFDAFEGVMNRYTCDEYINKYKENTNEMTRLQTELSQKINK